MQLISRGSFLALWRQKRSTRLHRHKLVASKLLFLGEMTRKRFKDGQCWQPEHE